VHLWLLLLPHGEGGGRELLLATGAYALAWTAGLLFVVAPAGAGVRELALVAALAPVLASPAALAVAVLSRVLMTLGDLVWAGVAAAVRPRNGASAPKVPKNGDASSTLVDVQQQGRAADV
jgi:uncharacterized membrane protein YbhN (UPF0104 family)